MTSVGQSSTLPAVSAGDITLVARCLEDLLYLLNYIWERCTVCLWPDEPSCEVRSETCEDYSEVVENFRYILDGSSVSNIDLSLQLTLLPPELFRGTTARFLQRLEEEEIRRPEVSHLNPDEFIRTYLVDPRWFAIYREATRAYLEECFH